MEWTPLGASDFMRVEYMLRLNGELAALRAAVLARFGVTLATTVVPVAGGEASPLLASHINIIERAIDDLAGVVRPEGLQATKTWRGENRDASFLDYRDVNRWFESLAIIRAAMV